MKPPFFYLSFLMALFILSVALATASADDKKKTSREKTKFEETARNDKKSRQEKSEVARKSEDPTKAEPTKTDPSESESESTRHSSERLDRPERPTSEMRTWFGVATSRVDLSLRNHLELEDGFGIQVQEVVGDSPAEKVGLRRHDILTQFNDQMLISPEHLSLLVRRENKGNAVEVTYLRKGQEKKTKVTLAAVPESRFQAREMEGRPSNGRNLPQMPRYGDHFDQKQWHESIKNRQDYWHEWMKGALEKKKDVDRKNQPDESVEKPPAVSVEPGFPVSVFGSQSVVKIDNQHGEITITRENGDHHMEMLDAKGELVFEGPYEPEKGVAGLPPKAQKHLKLMKLDNLKILTPPQQPVVPEKTSAESAAPSKPTNSEDELL
ncbi:MAG: PDZ domain-containing protein [Verrucomicrobiota bacterium]